MHFVSTALVAGALTLMSCGNPVESSSSSATPTPSGNAISLVASSQVGLTPAGTSQPTVVSGWTRYEAEDTTVATPIGTFSTDKNGFESGGQAIGGFATAPLLANFSWTIGGGVKFTLKGLTAGTYTVRLGFNGDDDKVILVSNDQGSTSTQITLPAVAGTNNAWNLAQTVDLNVTFAAGDDTLWVSEPVKLKAADNAAWINIDYIDIKKQ
ncbi:MAG TPA: hypothetical protein VMB23_03445 [Spirochaetia bacterium]|jgi:hypothetical protein|nr:hypothetical protein [Spirochaetia bacterium]